MSRRYLDVSSVFTTNTTAVGRASQAAGTYAVQSQQPNLNNSIDIKGKLTIQDQDLQGSDVKELKAMVGFLRHAIASDPRMHELWVAYQAREKILR